MSDNPQTSPLWPADNSAVTSHIELLQGIINRLADNSASCKTWCITLVGALLSLAGATHVEGVAAFALLPVVMFGFMDTMYLAQERAYRDLYTRIVGTIRDRSYKLSTAFEARAPLDFGGFCAALTSWSVYPIYLGLILAYLTAHFTGWLSLLTAV